MMPSHTLAAMKRAILLSALLLTVAAPAFAQSTEFGVLVGASRRFISGGTAEENRGFLDNELSLRNSAFDLYYAMDFDDDTRLKFKLGRIETPVAFEVANPSEDPNNPDDDFLRRDVEGEVQHASAVIEWRFDEPWGATGIFGGLGLYRQSGDDALDSKNDYGFQIGLNADFPITRRYGALMEATYHYSRGAYSPRYLTLTGGLRIAF